LYLLSLVLLLGVLNLSNMPIKPHKTYIKTIYIGMG
jgi:predicted RND superfamily exporter protein